jgi:hypothetical protein
MLASGVTYPFVSELLKGVFVEVAKQDFSLATRETTDSRISLISGVHRKDVRRLRNVELANDGIAPQAISFGAQLIATWLGDERFLDAAGKWRPLRKVRGSDGLPSFEDLVASRSTDIRPRVVLDEWLHLGIVSIDDHDRLVLNEEAFIPRSGVDEQLYFYAHNLHDHAVTATENVLGSRPPQLERSVSYEALSEASIEQLDRRARHLGTKLLTDLNRMAMELEAKNLQDPGPTRRFTCGVYFCSEPSNIASGQFGKEPDPSRSAGAATLR